MRRSLLFVAPAFLLAASAVAHDAGLSIGLNFGADEPSGAAGGTLPSGASAGVLPQINWNNLVGASGTSAALVADSKGTSVPSTVSVTWTCPNTWSSTGRGEENNGFPAGSGDKTLMLGYLDSNDVEAGAVHVTVGNIDPSFTASGYDVVVYALGGTSANRYGAYSIGSVTNILNSAANPTGFVLDSGVGSSDTGNYVIFKNLTSPTFELIANAVTAVGGGFRAPVNAIQIVRSGQALTAVNVGGNAIGTVTENDEAGFTIVGGGNDIWDMSDEFTFGYAPKTGDFDVQVRVESLTPNARWSKAGIMARESLAEDSRYVFIRVSPPDVPTLNGGNGANDTKLMYRTGNFASATDGDPGENDGRHEDGVQNPPQYPNAWIRLTRVGNVFSGFTGTDGVNWTLVSSQDTSTAGWVTAGAGGAVRDDVLLGLAVSRHSGGPTATAIFKNYSSTAVPFRLTQASSRGNPNAILVTFTAPLDAASLVPDSFSISGVIPTAVSAGPRANTYWVTTDAPLVEGQDYTVECFSVTSGGVEPDVYSDTFTHGKGYEAAAIHIGHNKVRENGDQVLDNTSYLRGLFSSADATDALQSNGFFEDPLPDNGTNERFYSKIFGILNVATAGDYQFAVSSDDIGNLFLSTNTDPANKVAIAREPEWNGSRQYAATDRRAAGAPQNISAVKTLAAGNYYIEYTFAEGGGGNNGSAAWRPAGGPAFSNGQEPIPASAFTPSRYFNGAVRGELFMNLGPVSIVSQPESKTVVGGTPVSFAVRLDGTPAYSYQWRRNGQPIAGAIDPVYTIPVALATDDGAVFTCAVGNEFSSALSAAATLTVNIPTPPVLLSAKTDVSFTKVTLKFDKRVQPSSAQNLANYSIAGLTISSAVLDAAGTGVILTTSTQAEGANYTLSVSNVKEVTGNNALTPNPTSVSFSTFAYAPGYVVKDYYLGFTAGVDAIVANQPAPSDSCLVSLWELNEADQYENYAARISGYFVATETGPHTFFLASDDGGRLFMSTDANPANKTLIASEPVWANRREWTGAGGGGGRVGVTSASGGPQANVSGPINLVAGQKYYMESFVQEGGGGDNMGVAVRLPSHTEDPINTTTRGIGGLNLGSFVSPAGAVATITTQPSDLTLAANAIATFTVGATASSPLCGGTATYQWYRNGNAIAGATSASYSFGPLTETDSGSIFKVTVRVPGLGVTSRDALLTVTAAQPVHVVGAMGSANLRDVTITFDQLISEVSAVSTFNYTSAQLGAAQTAVLNPGGTSVTVAFEVAQTPGETYTVNVSGVESTVGQQMDPLAVDVTFKAFELTRGFMHLSIYDGIAGTAVSALTADAKYPNNPSRQFYMAGFDTTSVMGDFGADFGGLIQGFFIPPTSGNWIFYIKSDDASELWLDSNDGNGLVKIQEELGCCGTFSGHATAPIALTGGTPYRIQVLYKEGGGGDFAQVAAKLDTDPTPPDSLRPISGDSVATYANTQGVSLAIAQQPADQVFLVGALVNPVFSVGVAATVPGQANPQLFYQWYRDGVAISGANGSSYTLAPRLSDNGAKFKVQVFALGAQVTSSEATLTVAQPNTAPKFVCGPDITVGEDSGAQSVLWASGIQNHSVVRVPVQISYDFSSVPAGVTMVNRVLDLPSNVSLVRDGLLKLTDAVNGSQGGFLTPALPGLVESFTVAFKLRIGGGTCCGGTLPGGGADRPADGMSITIGDVAVPLSFPAAAEEGAAVGAGVVVAFDTWDNNGTDEAPAVDVKVGGAVRGFQSLAGVREGGRAPAGPLVLDPATGQDLTFDTGTGFANVRIHMDADGTLDVDFKGVRVIDNLATGNGLIGNSRIAFGARTGGANANHWIDDLTIEAFQPDSSSGEAAQVVHFNVTTDHPEYFSVQPAIAADGTLTYTPAANAKGVAMVTVVAQDDGGTAYGGSDTSAPCTFAININGVCDVPVAANDSGVTIGVAPVAINVLSNDSDVEGGLAIASVTQGANGTVAINGASVTYTANAGFVGTDSFTYTVANSCGSQATATVTVAVGADGQPPTAVIGAEALVDFSPDFENPVLISCNWWNACLVLDGWTSSAADGGALTYLWFDELEAVPFDSGVVTTNCYEVGTHTITLIVEDSNGRTGTDSKTIEVLTAPLAIELLMEKVQQSHVTRAIKRELVASLRVALNKAKDEKIRQTQNALDAFEKKVRAKLTQNYPEEARVWIKWSQSVSTGMEKCIKPPRKAKDHWDKKKDGDDKD